ncbi:MAG: hypothetical protein OEY14_17735, partial [Myxococcales bacterium]|nr:hypothetical protein [Myxococcales bacterium]
LLDPLRSPLERWRLEPIETLGDAPPPLPFWPRILGGGCVPELPCELLVWVGAPAAAIRLEPSASLEPLGAAEPATQTDGFVRLRLIVRAPEAAIVLIASRDGAEVARRRARLSIRMGGTQARLIPDGLLGAGEAPPRIEANELGGRPIVIDAYRDGVWEQTASLEGEAGPLPIALEPGLWHLQIRADPFSAERATTRLLWVLSEAESAAEAIASLAREAETRARADAEAGALDAPPRLELARRVLEGAIPAGMEAEVAALLLAEREESQHALPAATHGASEEAASRSELERLLRDGFALLVLLAGVLGALLLFRRGLRAAREADALLEQASRSELAPSAARTSRLPLIGAALLLLGTFAATAAIVLSRGCF